MSNKERPPRARISSTARAPAMPFPMTTNRCLPIRHSSRFVLWLLGGASVELVESEVDDGRPSGALRRGNTELELALGEDVFDDRQGDVLCGARADREVAHRFAVPHEDETDQLAG